MSLKRARCTNTDGCELAKNKTVVEIPQGGGYECPVCGQTLRVESDGTGRPPLWMIVAGLVGVLALVGSIALFANRDKHQNPDTASTTSPVATATNGTSVPVAPDLPTVASEFTFFYERSGQKWIDPLVEDLNKASGTQGKITALPLGSRQAKQVLLYGQDKDEKGETVKRGGVALWNPADGYWPRKLSFDWQNNHISSTDPIQHKEILLRTYLVLVMWADRAEVFNQALLSDRYKDHPWRLLHDLATIGWAAPGINGKKEWGRLKMIQSNPLESNSGMVALGLMYREYRSEHPNALTSDPKFVQWMTEIEQAASGNFVSTTSKTIGELQKGGTTQYDVAVCYEQNALGAIDKGEKGLRIIYPGDAPSVDFPIAVLQGNWINDRQRKDATALADYLLSPEMQRKAIGLGFRPGQSLGMDALNQLDTDEHRQMGFKVNPVSASGTLEIKEFDDLQFQWGKYFGKSSTAPGPKGK